MSFSRTIENGVVNMTHFLSAGLVSVLHANAPAVDRAAKLELYAWLVGNWEANVVTHSPDGTRHEGQAEIHAGWILEGRAIQDVWTIPLLKDRAGGAPSPAIAGNWYGTTIRVYDPVIDAWRIFWIDPATNSFQQQIGRQRDSDIVQQGTMESGALSRWSFTEITPQSFHWLGEFSKDNGASWSLAVEVLARRSSPN